MKNGILKKLFQTIQQNKLRSILFFVGALFVLYPVISQTTYYLLSHQEVTDFHVEKKKIKESDVERRLHLAQQYNETVTMSALGDPFSTEKEDGLREYARMLEVQEKIGIVSIPSIGQELPIYAGTSESILQKGVGHLEGSSLPIGGPSTHAVLTAHRGLPTARLFTDLNQLKKGDIFYVENVKEKLAYQVDEIKVVEPTDLSAVKVVEGKDYVTLLTCTPYMINSHRLLVRGVRVPLDEKQAEKREKESQKAWWTHQVLLIGGCVIVACLLVAIIFILKKKRVKKGR